MKKFLILLLTVAVAAALVPAPADARHRIERPGLRAARSAGIVLGTIGILGALTALDIIVDSAQAHQRYDAERYHGDREGSRYDCRPDGAWWDRCPEEEGYGRWEWTKVWTPGHCEKVWVPAYRDPWGRWCGGHWDRRYIEGSYTWKQVWVAGR